jgi:hypothetical protein
LISSSTTIAFWGAVSSGSKYCRNCQDTQIGQQLSHSPLVWGFPVECSELFG